MPETSGPARGTPPTQAPPPGSIGPTRFGHLLAVFLAGGLLGFGLARVSERLGAAPQIQWAAVYGLAAIAVVLFGLAFVTYRIVHRGLGRLDPHRAVNLLLLAKASALVGALLAGGYLGFGLQFVGQMDALLPRERVIRGVAAAAAGLVIMVAALLLERACRVPRRDNDPRDDDQPNQSGTPNS